VAPSIAQLASLLLAATYLNLSPPPPVVPGDAANIDSICVGGK